MIEKSFKKLLGNGRAWRAPHGFTADFYTIIANRISDVCLKVKNLKYTHFPTRFYDLQNVENDEELFNNYNPDAADNERATLTERNWGMLCGSLHYKEIENALNTAGFRVRVLENYKNSIVENDSFRYGNSSFGETVGGKRTQYGGSVARVIGNGNLTLSDTVKDPATLKDGKNSFFVYGDFTPTESEWSTITRILLETKPAHSVAICLIYKKS